LKQTDFDLWQKNFKEGGITSTSKVDMDITMRDFIQYIFGENILTGAAFGDVHSKIKDLPIAEILTEFE
jgi:hypothetical protein